MKVRISTFIYLFAADGLVSGHKVPHRDSANGRVASALRLFFSYFHAELQKLKQKKRTEK